MVTDTLYDNKPMRGLAIASGYTVTANPKDARLVKLEKQVSAWTAAAERPKNGCRNNDDAFRELMETEHVRR